MQQIQDFNIRYIKPEDTSYLLPMIKKVVSKTGYPTSDDIILNLINKAVENLDFSCIVLADLEDNPKGYVFCTITPLYFSPIKLACCLSIWIEEDSRKHSKDMLKAFESWAKYKQADQLMFSTFEGVSPKGLGSVYKRFGCSVKEVQYWKDIT